MSCDTLRFSFKSSQRVDLSLSFFGGSVVKQQRVLVLKQDVQVEKSYILIEIEIHFDQEVPFTV